MAPPDVPSEVSISLIEVLAEGQAVTINVAVIISVIAFSHTLGRNLS